MSGIVRFCRSLAVIRVVVGGLFMSGIVRFCRSSDDMNAIAAMRLLMNGILLPFRSGRHGFAGKPGPATAFGLDCPRSGRHGFAGKPGPLALAYFRRMALCGSADLLMI